MRQTNSFGPTGVCFRGNELYYILCNQNSELAICSISCTTCIPMYMIFGWVRECFDEIIHIASQSHCLGFISNNTVTSADSDLLIGFESTKRAGVGVHNGRGRRPEKYRVLPSSNLCPAPKVAELVIFKLDSVKTVTCSADFRRSYGRIRWPNYLR